MENSYKRPKKSPRKRWFKDIRLFKSVQSTFSDSAERHNDGSSKQKSEGRFRPFAAVSSLLDGSMLTQKWVINNIPYLIFLGAIAIFYISNSATAERNRRKAMQLEAELKELRYKYISTKSSVMYLSNPSQISERLRETGIRENLVPPVKIFITSEETNP